MMEPVRESLSELESLVARHGADRSGLIPILQDIQERLGYLSEEAVDELARLIGVSPNEVYGVATFYAQFRFRPPAEHTIQVCLGTACHVRGGHQILGELERRLGIKAGETTTDGKFDLERVACLGCCALAPVVAVDGKVHSRVAAKEIRSMLSECGGERHRKDV
jgi:NADH-quinone oxidoreductase subunit E